MGLGFQSQFRYGLASSDTHSDSGMGYLHLFEHSGWVTFRNSLSGTILPKNIEERRSRKLFSIVKTVMMYSHMLLCFDNHRKLKLFFVF
jgi:hypothetical protein